MTEFNEQQYADSCRARRAALEAVRANATETRAAQLFLWRNLGNPSGLPIPDEDWIEDHEDGWAATQAILDFVDEQGPDWQQAFDEADFWIGWCIGGYERFVREEFPHGSWPGLILSGMESATYELGRLAALGNADLERSDVEEDDRERIEPLLRDVVASARHIFKQLRVMRDLTGSGWPE